MVSVSGYLIGSQEANQSRCRRRPSCNGGISIYFATERGRAGYEKIHGAILRSSSGSSPRRQWKFDDATFDRSAASFDNPDHVAVVIHNYRWRLGLAEGEPRYDDLENRLAAGPRHRRADDHARGRRQRCAASGPQRLCQEVLRQVHASRTITGGIGHNLPPGGAAGVRSGGDRHRRLRYMKLALHRCSTASVGSGRSRMSAALAPHLVLPSRPRRT